jgi:hypothetical protein
MKTIVRMGLALAMMGTSVQAQATSQASENGPSGVDVYSVQVTGADGSIYNCRPDIVDVEGVPTRFCRRSSVTGATDGTLFSGGLGGGVGAGIGVAVIAIALIGGDGSTSTTTSTSP